MSAAVVALRAGLTDTFVIAGRSMRHFVRQPQLLLFSTVQPIMFVILFAFVFGGAIESSLPPGVEYVDFLLPGIFIQSVAFRATQTAVGLSEDLERGVVDRFRSMPIARYAVLAGRTTADLVRSIFVTLLMVGVGYAIGFRFQDGLLAAIGAIAVVAVFGYAITWIFAYIGLSVKGAEAAQSAGFIGIFPLVFASSAFVPVDTMPGWLEAFADANPVTAAVNAARAFTLGTPLGSDLLILFAWVAAIMAFFVPLSVWRYRQVSTS